ncbi:MAG: cation-translocating P-type ATPase [Bacteroidia bacterium]|nr:cation-translocating P-type ATPase [Bacteroidia bacterium]
MTEKVELNIEGMDCASCAQTVKKAMEDAGAQNVWVDFAGARAACELNDITRLDEVLHKIRKAGYGASLKRHNEEFHSHSTKIRIMLWLNFPSFIFMMLGMLFHYHVFHSLPVIFLFTVPSFITGIMAFVPTAIASLRYRKPNMDVLVSVGFLSSLSVFYFGGISEYYFNKVSGLDLHLFAETGVSVVFFILLGKWIEKKSLDATLEKAKLLKQRDLLDTHYRKLPYESSDDVKHDALFVNASEIRKDDVLIIPEGSFIPADSWIEEGMADVDESALTGEPLPVHKTKGDEVMAGTLVISGNLKIRTKEGIQKSFIGELQKLMEEARKDKPKIQDIGDRVAAWFVPAVVAVAVITFLGFMIFGAGFQVALLRSVTVLVISCPCAVGLAAPVAVAVGLGSVASKQVLFKKSAAFQELKNCDAFVFDKTGTLTSGEFEVVSWKNLSDLSDRDILKMVLAVQTYSNHPIAVSMTEWLKKQGITPAMIVNVREEKGRGIYFERYEEPGKKFFIGKTNDQALENRLLKVILESNEKVFAEFYLDDMIRDEAKELITFLNMKKKRIYLLSGDRKNRCLALAEHLGIPKENVFYEKTPQAKLEVLKSMGSTNKICMVGDGVNDAPAMNLASVSISLHKGMKITSDSADILVYDLKQPLKKLMEAFKFSENLVNVIYQNYAWALAYNLIAIPLALSGSISPVWAAVSMAISDLVVVGNSLRLRK